MKQRARRSWIHVAGIVGGAAGVFGCAEPGLYWKPEELALPSAGRTGCSPEMLQIANVREKGRLSSWTATCHGKMFQCSAVLLTKNVKETMYGGGVIQDVACTPRGSGPAAGDSESANLAPQTGVTRERIEKGTGWVLRARIVEEPFLMIFSVVFDEGSDSIAWLTTPSRSKDYDVDETCPVVLLIDGEKVPVARAPSAGDRQLIKAKVPLALVERMAAAKRVVGRICDREWRLSPESRVILQEFLARMGEEHLLDKSSLPATSPADSTAKPAGTGR